MKQTYLTNLILLAVVLGLLWMVYSPNHEKKADNTLSNIETTHVSQIEIQHKDKAPLKLQKTAQGWEITAPYHARANATRINMVLDVLHAHTHSQYKTQDKSMMSQFGFDKNSPVLTVDHQQFVFGGTESISGRRYVLHNGTISLIDEQMYPLLNASADSFINSRLFGENAKISQIKLSYLANNKLQTDHTLTISKKDGHWQSNASPELATDKISSLIQSWKGAYAMQVSYLDDKALQKVEGVPIEITLQNRPKPISLVAKTGKHQLLLTNKVTHLQYHFPNTLVTQLFISADSKPKSKTDNK